MKTRTGFRLHACGGNLVALPSHWLWRKIRITIRIRPPCRKNRLCAGFSFIPAWRRGDFNAVPNRPLTTGDNLWVPTSRAEVQIDRLHPFGTRDQLDVP
jgi:hypothetical protein